MNIEGKTIWQHAAGDTDRDVSAVCLNWDVILNGPGYLGKWPECQELMHEDGWTSKKITGLRRYCEEMSDGDIVVLRLGTTDVLAVGVVVGDYQWSDQFGDVDGWDLQHIRRVRWLWQPDGIPKRFPAYAMKFGDTTQILTSDEIIMWLEELAIPEKAFSRELASLPEKSEDKLDFSEISEYLFDKGVASHSIESLMKEIGELTRIASWYQKTEHPSEYETVAYLVAPLLRVLGWTPQRMAIEWRRVDVALFSELPREDKNLAVVIEAKKMGNSCLTALSQAEAYAEGKASCRKLIVTDGIRYGVYVKVANQFQLYAYLNLIRLRSNYPVYGCQGAKTALFAMTPEWQQSSPSGISECS